MNNIGKAEYLPTKQWNWLTFNIEYKWREKEKKEKAEETT